MINPNQKKWKGRIISGVVVAGVLGAIFAGSNKFINSVAPECVATELLPMHALPEEMIKQLTPDEGCQLYDAIQFKPEDESLPCQRFEGPLNFCADK